MKRKMKKLSFALIFIFSMFFLNADRCTLYAEDSVTITTYYPAPSGIYKDLAAQIYYDYDDPVYQAGGAAYFLDPYPSANSSSPNTDISLTVGGDVGVGTPAPQAKLHIAGSSDDVQAIIQANSAQSNTNPLLELRDSAGNPIMALHSDSQTNVFVGVGAGRTNNAAGGQGGYNTFIGCGAGYSNTTAPTNTAVGYESMHNNTTGNNNTAVGYWSLSSNIDGLYNTAVGLQALRHNTTGDGNVGVGYNAAMSNTTGTYNTAVGWDALVLSTTSNYNTAVGAESLHNTTSGSNNTAVGKAALYTNTGYNNTATGFQALYSNTASADNSAYGVGALYGNTGYYNSAYGKDALYSNTTGGANTGVGWQALYSNTTGQGNAVYGASAYHNNVGGNDNTIIGNAAGRQNQTGSNNVFLGYDAGYNGSGSNNVFLGYAAGLNETGSNKLYIANSPGTPLIYGDFSTGRIGIGTTNPTTKFAIKDLDSGGYGLALHYDTVSEAVYCVGSSMRYKDNVLILKDDFYKILQLTPKSFTYKNGNKERDVGYIAEDVDKLGLKNLVIYDKESKPDGLKYEKFSLYMLEVIKDQQKTIEELKANNKEFENRLKLLEAKLK